MLQPSGRGVWFNSGRKKECFLFFSTAWGDSFHLQRAKIQIQGRIVDISRWIEPHPSRQNTRIECRMMQESAGTCRAYNLEHRISSCLAHAPARVSGFFELGWDGFKQVWSV